MTLKLIYAKMIKKFKEIASNIGIIHQHIWNFSLEDEVKKALEKLKNPDRTSELQSAPKADESVFDDNDLKSIDLSPHEAAIRDYLENHEPLPKESLNLLLPRLWNQEPYCSKGFVLEGFPQTAEDVTYMLENNLLFDFVIFLNAEAADLVPRLLPGRLAKWKVKMAKIMTNKKIVADWRAEKKKRIREERRKILIEKINERKNHQTVSIFHKYQIFCLVYFFHTSLF